MQTLYIVLLIVVVVILIGWIGLQVKPKSFDMPALAKSELKTASLPTGLPKAVERFYRTVYGDQIPVIDTVVITGRGRIRPFGTWLTARFVFVHNAGGDYWHYFEATFFGMPFLTVNEGYVDGKSFF